MYKKYQIIKLERKTTANGKNKIDADLQDFDGFVEDKVTIWDDFPNFANLKMGNEVTGQVVAKVNGQYTNKSLYGERTEGWGGGKKAPSVNISKLMDKKAENIAEAQERKNDSIAYFNAINSAIALAEQMVTTPHSDQMKEFIKIWRDWFLSEWNKYNSGDVTDKRTPF